MSQLDGKIAVVAGGTGQVGEGIVKRLIQAGATVIVPVRSKNAANQLAGYLDSLPDKRLVLIEGDLSNAESAALFRNELLRKFSRIDLAVASLGGWWKGRKLHEVNLDDWESILSNNLTSHFIAGKTFLSIFLQQHQGMYVMVNGAASETVVPGSAPISVVAAAQSMM
nr:SDR family NAD(P)-dependent oxidoreductase [Calditrichia bacterium]